MNNSSLLQNISHFLKRYGIYIFIDKYDGKAARIFHHLFWAISYNLYIT